MPEAVAALPAPRRVQLETERFRLLGLGPQQVTERFCDWLRDPEIASSLNRPPRASLDQLRREVLTANGRTRFYVGIYTRANEPIGFYMLSGDPLHRTLTFNVVVGEKQWWGERVVLETRAALLDHFFDERGVEKASGTPLARNFPSIFNYKRQGWRLEGTLKGQCIAHDGSGRLDQLQFGLLAMEWRAIRGNRP